MTDKIRVAALLAAFLSTIGFASSTFAAPRHGGIHIRGHAMHMTGGESGFYPHRFCCS